jgi:hypothetical protein
MIQKFSHRDAAYTYGRPGMISAILANYRDDFCNLLVKLIKII